MWNKTDIENKANSLLIVVVIDYRKVAATIEYLKNRSKL